MRIATIGRLIVLLGIFPTIALAQNDPEATSPDTPPAAEEVDTRPISGAGSLAFGPLAAGLSITPAFRFSQAAESFDSGRSFDYLSTLGGSLELTRARNHQQFALNYDGAGSFSTRPLDHERAFQNLRVSQEFAIKRWTFGAFDTVNYSPESTTNGGNNGGFSSSLINLLLNSGVSPSLLPSQDVFTASTARVSNSLAGQVQYNLSFRNSLTIAGSYGVLRFLERDLMNSNQYTGFATFERMMSRHNSVAVKYVYTTVTYHQIPDSFHTHWIQGTIGRRITDRLQATIAVGPEFVAGSKQTIGAKRLTWASDVTLAYRQRRYSLGLTGSRKTTSGAGVMVGARVDSAKLTASRDWFRTWHTSVHGGYSRNVALVHGAGTYNLRSVGGEVRHDFAPWLSTYLGYSGYYQTSNAVTASPFILDGWRHTITIGFEWHPHPTVTRQ